VVKLKFPGKIDYRIYEFYLDQFEGRKTYSSHHWSGYIRIKYGTDLKSRLLKFYVKMLSGFDFFEKNSI